MNLKIVLGVVVIVAAVIFGSISFFETNIEYTDISGAKRINRKVQLRGEWNKEKEASFDPQKTQFTFYLVDESGDECKVVLDGTAPNNFEMATSVVAKGQFVDDGRGSYFHASEILTKCPSKYEAQAEEVNKSI